MDDTKHFGACDTDLVIMPARDDITLWTTNNTLTPCVSHI